MGVGAGVAGVVLAGGASRRMGTSKAALPHRGGSLLGHVVGVLQRACAPVLVVGAPGRELPPTPGATVLRDDVLDRGPLAGVARGLAGAADAGCGLAVVCATDLPLLAPAVVLRLLDLVGPDDDVVVPVVDGQVHPLCAVYRTGLAGAAAELAADAAPVRALLRRARTREVGRAELLADPAVAAADPGLASVRGANTPAEWAGLTGSGAAGPGPAGE